MMPNNAFHMQQHMPQQQHQAPMPPGAAYAVQPSVYAQHSAQQQQQQQMHMQPGPHQQQQQQQHPPPHMHQQHPQQQLHPGQHPQHQQQQQPVVFGGAPASASVTQPVHMANPSPASSAYHPTMQQHQAQMARIAQANQPHMVNGQPQRPPMPANMAFAQQPQQQQQHLQHQQQMHLLQQQQQHQQQSNPNQPPRTPQQQHQVLLQQQQQQQQQQQHNMASASQVNLHSHPQSQHQQQQSQQSQHPQSSSAPPMHQPHPQTPSGPSAQNPSASQPNTAHNSPMPNVLAQRPPQHAPHRTPTPISHNQPMQNSGSLGSVPSAAGSSVGNPQGNGPMPLRQASLPLNQAPSTPTHTRPPSAAPTPSLQPAVAPQSMSIARPGTTSPTSNQLPANLAAQNPTMAANLMTGVNGTMSSGLAGVDSIAGAPGPNPQLQAQFPSGAGVLRLLQYSEGLSSGGNRAEMDYWRAFVNEFFIPTGVFRLILWNTASREQKGFEVPTCVLPRFLLTNYVSGLRSSQLQLENPREYQTGWPPVNPLPPPPPSHKYLNSFPSANVTHQVDVSKATFFSNFDNGWQVQMTGLLRACFVPWAVAQPGEPGRMAVRLRLESLDFTVHAHTGFIPRVAIQKSKVDHPLPNSLVSNILSTGDTNAPNGAKKGQARGGAAAARKDEAGDVKRDENGDPAIKTEDGSGSSDDDVKNQSGYTVSVEKTFLPDYPVNEYGISLRAMRCLEITESVCQLRDLIDLSMRDKLGPVDAMRKFAAQFREMQSGRPMAQTGAADTNGANQPPSTNAAQTPSQVPGRPPSAQGGGPTENGVHSNHASPSVPNGVAGLKRKGKTAPSPSPKLSNLSNPAKRQR